MFEEKSDDEILDEMLNILCKESEIKLPKNLSITDKRDVLNNLMLIRPTGYLDEYFVNLQNEFLKREMQDKLISLDNIKYNKKGMFISADILNLKADMIVIFTYRLFADVNLGTDNIDTELILRGGVNINEDFAKIYYDKALKIRDDITKEFNRVFKEYDLIIGPTTTRVAPLLGTSKDDPHKAFMDDVLVIPVNMAGLPALSVPVGVNSNNLPIGLHIIGKSYDEATIYQLASILEEVF